MNFSNLRRISVIALTTLAGATSIYLATLPNPTQPQKDLGHTTNQILLLGSQSLLKEPKRRDMKDDRKLGF